MVFIFGWDRGCVVSSLASSLICAIAPFPDPSISPGRRFPATADAHNIMVDIFVLSSTLCCARGSPILAVEALVAAGFVPPFVTLLGRWESLKTALPGDASNSPVEKWTCHIEVMVRIVAALAARSPPARRQLREGGAALLLRAIAGDPVAGPTAIPGLCRDVLRCLGAA